MSDKNLSRLRRSRQTRLKIRELGHVRLTVHRTNCHIYAQITNAAGDKVLAIGSPFGLQGSVSEGIVSGLGRSFFVEETQQVIQGMIQFDAAVNPGSSGGPLVDMNGRVIGIVSGIINPTNARVFIGLGFAVPIEAAGAIMAPLG